ncbi:hypothetical protein [Niallia sp. 01092]
MKQSGRIQNKIYAYSYLFKCLGIIGEKEYEDMQMYLFNKKKGSK